MSKISMPTLLNLLGEDRVTLQPLDMCMASFKAHKRENEISFVTQQSITGLFDMKTVKMGMILWLDRDLVAEALALTDPDPQYGNEEQIEALRNLRLALAMVKKTRAKVPGQPGNTAEGLHQALDEFFQEMPLGSSKQLPPLKE